MKALLIATFAAQFCIPMMAEGVPCWIRCHNPPEIKSAEMIADVLRCSSNPRLSWLARATGLLTTYAGKLLGIQGWKDYHLQAQVSGTVTHAAGSDDGLFTIDVQVAHLRVGDRPIELLRPSFIRVEVFPLVRVGAQLPKKEGDNVCVSGKLMWDADGFLEIHPKKSQQIQLHPC